MVIFILIDFPYGYHSPWIVLSIRDMKRHMIKNDRALRIHILEKKADRHTQHAKLLSIPRGAGSRKEGPSTC